MAERRSGLQRATWGGPSGIVHGWIRHHGRGGWMPTCYPNGAHPGWFGRGQSDEDMERRWTEKPITCKRCLKRLGRHRGKGWPTHVEGRHA